MIMPMTRASDVPEFLDGIDIYQLYKQDNTYFAKIKNSDLAIKRLGLKKPYPTAKLVGLSFGDNFKNMQVKKRFDISDPKVFYGKFYIGFNTYDVRVISTGYGVGGLLAESSQICFTPEGCQQASVSIRGTKTVTSGYSTTTGVNSSAISASVGYNIGSSQSVSTSGTASSSLKYYQKLVLQAYEPLEIKHLEVYSYLYNEALGTGSAWRASDNKAVMAQWLIQMPTP